MAQQIFPPDKIALAPLVGKANTQEAHWLGALLAKLLTEQLAILDVPVMDYNDFARQIEARKYRVPLRTPQIEELHRSLKLRALVHGRYVLDEDGKMLGIRLLAEAPDIPRVPVEAASPLAAFDRFIERMTLALAEQIGIRITPIKRENLSKAQRPARFEAFQQLAQAQISWARGQNELALASLASALALDPDFEEAAAIEVVIARAVGDIGATRDSFIRWAKIAQKLGRPLVAGERLMMLGHWLVERSEWGPAREAYQEARRIFEKESSAVHMAQVMDNLANLGLVRGQTEEALQTYRRSLRTFETEGDTRAEATTCFNLALAHKNFGQPNEARQAIEQAMMLARKLEDTRLEALCLAQRGALHDDAGRWAHAAADYDQAAKLLDVVGDDRGRAQVKSQQAVLLKQQGATDQAERLMLEALELFNAEGDSHELAVIWLNLADLYLAMREYARCWENAKRAHEVFVRLKSGWAEISGELIETLQRMPEVDTADPPEDTPDEELPAEDQEPLAEDPPVTPARPVPPAEELPAVPTQFGPPTVFGGEKPFRMPPPVEEDEENNLP